MIVLGNTDIAALLPMETAIERVTDIMREVSRGNAEMPLRSIVDVGEPNMMGIMPGAMSRPGCFGVKLVSLFPDNPSAGHSSHQGAMVLFEPRHGAAIAIMNASALTAIRTAAASAVATRVLAREGSEVLTLIGTGEQAEHHLEAMCLVRPIRTLHVVGRSDDSARNFAERARRRYTSLAVEYGTSARDLCRNADIICCLTSSSTPVLLADWVPPGAHVNAVGASVPSKREIDTELVKQALLFVDFRPSALAQAGEIILALQNGDIAETHIVGEIGELLAGSVAGRKTDRDISLYRSLGIVAQDLGCAMHVWEQAQRLGRGVTASLD